MIERPNRIWLPRTGQTTSYATGDDGYFQAGNPRSTRFVDNGNNTVSDRATGLMWVKEPGACGGAFGSAGSPSQMTWANAVSECLGLTYGGYSDWRLPTAKELMCLVDIGVGSAPMIDLMFVYTQSTCYWSSTTNPFNDAYAYYTDFNFSTASALSRSLAKTNSFYVRPVRGGRLNANG